MAHLHAGWHHELCEVLEDVAALAAKRAFTSAAKRFGELRRAFERHLREEDEYLLPLCGRLGEPGVQLGGVIREQHARLVERVSELQMALTAWNQAKSSQACGQLLSAFEEHHRAEEALLSRLEAGGPVGQ